MSADPRTSTPVLVVLAVLFRMAVLLLLGLPVLRRPEVPWWGRAPARGVLAVTGPASARFADHAPGPERFGRVITPDPCDPSAPPPHHGDH